ncbi:MAG TPA: hypothetical protein HA272_01105 [Methanoregula sp.]|nr:hypothetical protein [Methanoregula sp.]
MDNGDTRTMAVIYFYESTGVVMIGLTIFTGAHLSPHTWTKIGGLFFGIWGGYWFLKEPVIHFCTAYPGMVLPTFLRVEHFYCISCLVRFF